MPTPTTESAMRWLPLVLALSLTACATHLPPPATVQPPQIPQPPAELMEPPQPGLWSEAVQKLFKQWQQLVMQKNPS